MNFVPPTLPSFSFRSPSLSLSLRPAVPRPFPPPFDPRLERFLVAEFRGRKLVSFVRECTDALLHGSRPEFLKNRREIRWKVLHDLRERILRFRCSSYLIVVCIRGKFFLAYRRLWLMIIRLNWSIIKSRAFVSPLSSRCTVIENREISKKKKKKKLTLRLRNTKNPLIVH